MYFKDLGKPITEFLDADYLVRPTLRLKTTSSNGLVWSAEGEVLADRNISGKITATLKQSDNISLDGIRVNSDGRIFVEASLQSTDSLKLRVSAEDGRHEPGRPLHSFGKLGFDYTLPRLNISGDIDVVNGPIFHGSLVTQYNQTKLGLESIWNSHLEDRNERPQLLGLNLGVEYLGKDWEGCIRTTEVFGKLNIAYIHHVSNIFDVCGFISYGLRNNYQKLILGTNYRLDDASSLKMKIDSNAKLCASFLHQLSPGTKLVISSEVQVNAKETQTDATKIGFGLFFE